MVLLGVETGAAIVGVLNYVSGNTGNAETRAAGMMDLRIRWCFSLIFYL